jgi:hypothetical protein
MVSVLENVAKESYVAPFPNHRQQLSTKKVASDNLL